MTDYLERVALRGAGLVPADGPIPIMPRSAGRFETDWETTRDGWAFDLGELSQEIRSAPLSPAVFPPTRSSHQAGPRSEIVITDDAPVVPTPVCVGPARKTASVDEAAEAGSTAVDRTARPAEFVAREAMASEPQEPAATEDGVRPAPTPPSPANITFAAAEAKSARQGPDTHVHLAPARAGASPPVQGTAAGRAPPRAPGTTDSAVGVEPFPDSTILGPSGTTKALSDVREHQPPVTVNIGRIEVEIASVPPPVPGRREAERSQGFAMYDRARRGYLR